MKNLKFLFCLLLLGWEPIYAQSHFLYDQNFAAYNTYFEKESGITFQMPKNFTDLNQYFIGVKVRNASTSPAAAFFIGMTLKADQDCIVGYPGTSNYMSKRMLTDKSLEDTLALWRARNANMARGVINHEIKAALG